MNKNKLETMKKALRIQGYDGNWNYDEYMFGLYNGMELMLAYAEGREPVYREIPETGFVNKGHKLIEFDWLITNGYPVYDESFIGRKEKGWKVVSTLPANTVHPKASPGDMVTIFARFTPYPESDKTYEVESVD